MKLKKIKNFRFCILFVMFFHQFQFCFNIILIFVEGNLNYFGEFLKLKV